jgi:hypothetical protein
VRQVALSERRDNRRMIQKVKRLANMYPIYTGGKSDE